MSISSQNFTISSDSVKFSFEGKLTTMIAGNTFTVEFTQLVLKTCFLV